MSPFRPSREATGPDPLLTWKVRLFVVGAALGIWGMVAETSWLVTVGLVILFVGMLLRFVGRGTPEDAEEDDEWGRDGAEDAPYPDRDAPEA